MSQPLPTQPTPVVPWSLQSSREGGVLVTLRGPLNFATAGAIWPKLSTQIHREPPGALTIEASAVTECDGAGLALLFLLTDGTHARRESVKLQGLAAPLAEQLARFKPDLDALNLAAAPQRAGLVVEVGERTLAMVADAREQVTLLGAIALGWVANLLSPRRMRWREVIRIFERSGVNALPIISLISLLVGLIIAFQAAPPFRQFGAESYLANLIGIIMTRELGPLMASILLAGRTGSAFAAELGTMKVNEELSALTTMGLDPLRFLVAQRLTAALLVTPLLVVYAIAVGIGGGVLVMVALDIPLAVVVSQMQQSVHVRDVLIGSGKGVIFGAIVALTGCIRGLQTGQGPSAVGDSTTRAVVSGILLIIVADAVVAVLTYMLNI